MAKKEEKNASPVLVLLPWWDTFRISASRAAYVSYSPGISEAENRVTPSRSHSRVRQKRLAS